MKDSKNSRGRLPDGSSNPIDIYVGSRIRFFRERLSLSQESLGKSLGISFQQIQKYELGRNRVSASRLWDISKILEVSIDDFFDGMDKEISQSSPRRINNVDDIVLDDPMKRTEALALIKAYSKISNRNYARSLLKLMMTLARYHNEEKKE